MVFQSDVSQVLEPIQGEYFFSLNSEDSFDPDLPLLRNHAQGGTMVLWKRSLDPFITTLQTPSSSFLPILLNIPGHPQSIHVSLYLPTAGKDSEFLDSLSLLTNLLGSLDEKYPDSLTFLRGDSNANPKNESRIILFQHFQELLNLKRVPLLHKTYHHFIGDGLFDSEIDVIMHSADTNTSEEITKIICMILLK